METLHGDIRFRYRRPSIIIILLILRRILEAVEAHVRTEIYNGDSGSFLYSSSLSTTTTTTTAGGDDEDDAVFGPLSPGYRPPSRSMPLYFPPNVFRQANLTAVTQKKSTNGTNHGTNDVNGKKRTERKRTNVPTVVVVPPL